MTIFDSDLIAGAPNASLNGIPFRINPQTTRLSYNVKTSRTQTVGGMVVQVFGVTLSDLVVEGYFGTGGWVEQQAFYRQIQGIVQATVDAQKVQPDLSQSYVSVDPPADLPTGSVNFSFPLLNYNFQVYVKSYRSVEGDSVVRTNLNFNPTWQLTLLIENDNTGLLTTNIANAYISRVAAGLGSGILTSSGQVNEYLGSNAAGIATFLAKYAGGASTFSQYISEAYGGTSTSSSGSASSSPTGTAPTTSGTGNEAQVWNFLIAKVASAYAAAGIMGNLQQESGFNPEALQPSTTSATPPWSGGDYNTGRGYGIAQWTDPGRQMNLQNYANSVNQNVNLLSVQLGFFWQELTTTYASTLDAVNAATSPTQAAGIFNAGYEGGSDPGGVREASAQTIYDTYATSKK